MASGPRSPARSPPKAPVWCSSTSLPTRSDALAKTLECESVVVDLADADGTADAISESIALLGGVDILVNNAGILQMAPILDMTVEDWDLTFDINVRSMFVTTQVAGRWR